MNYYKLKIKNNLIHMYKGEEAPNTNWCFYEPDIDTEKYYKTNGKTKKGNYAVIEIDEEKI